MSRLSVFAILITIICGCTDPPDEAKLEAPPEDGLQVTWYSCPEDYIRTLEIKVYEQDKGSDPFVFHPDELKGVSRPGSPWYFLPNLGFEMGRDYQRGYMPAERILILEAEPTVHQKLVDFHRTIGVPISRIEIAEQDAAMKNQRKNE